MHTQTTADMKSPDPLGMPGWTPRPGLGTSALVRPGLPVPNPGFATATVPLGTSVGDQGLATPEIVLRAPGLGTPALVHPLETRRPGLPVPNPGFATSTVC